MNERIKELSIQAVGKRSCSMIEAEYIKFAELIVQEMLQTCENHPAWTGRMIGEQIKQDFGVEE